MRCLGGAYRLPSIHSFTSEAQDGSLPECAAYLDAKGWSQATKSMPADAG
jgi:hypothetical protein